MKISDIFSVLIKWKKFIIINLLLIVIVTTALCFLIPEKFKSTATLMIEEDASSGLLSSVLPDVGSVLGGALFGDEGESVDKIFSFLESRKILLKVIDKFDLVDYYKISEYKIDNTLDAIKDDLDVDQTENGLVQISFIHKDPKVAAEIVDYIIKELINVNNEYATSHASYYRKYVEKRYNKNLSDLQIAEDNFELFQEKNDVYLVPEQFEIIFNSLADLESKLAAKEIELEYLKEVQGENSPQFQNASKELTILKNKIDDLSKGKSNIKNSLFSIDMDEVPSLQKEYLGLYRDVEIQNKLLEVTLPLYEQAVMEEQKSIPTIIILDKPNVPELKNSPKRAYIVIAVFLLFLFIHIWIVIRAERSLTGEERIKNLYELKEHWVFLKMSKFYKMKFN